jgi:hypothetical protein
MGYFKSDLYIIILWDMRRKQTKNDNKKFYFFDKSKHDKGFNTFMLFFVYFVSNPAHGIWIPLW